jgi:homoserine dehydrogenase
MRLVLVGFGNLGRGLCEVLAEKRRFLYERFGLRPRVVAVVDDSGAAVDPSGLDWKLLVSKAAQRAKVASFPRSKSLTAVEVIERVESEVVFELTPTNIRTGEPGLTHIRRAMKAGRHVITSNKGPLVVAFQELESLARRCGVEFRYSASVGGAIPIIELARKVLCGNEVQEIQGVLNGTTNYILSRMAEEGVPFSQVLREAQELGIAERDPTLDIEGIDTAAKLVILSNAILGRAVKLDDVKRTGITRITPQAMKLAKEAGCTIKLVGVASRKSIEVAPRLVPQDHPLAVGGTLNAVNFKLDLAREISITGFGAGPRETSSALIGDLIDLYRSLS